MKKEKCLRCMSFEHGTYYRKIKGKRVENLGRDKDAAFKKQLLWLADQQASNNKRTLRVATKIFRDDYVDEAGTQEGRDGYYWSKAWRKQCRLALESFDVAFGDMDPRDITLVDIKKYFAKVKKRSLSAAWSHRTVAAKLWDWMMDEGYVDEMRNPITRVKLRELKARTHCPTEEEFWAFYNFTCKPYLKIAMLLARGTGMRKGDIISKRLDEIAIDDTGIANTQSKTRAGHEPVKQFFEHNGYTRRALALSAEWREKHPTDYIMTNMDGGRLTISGFSSNWNREMTRAHKAGLLLDRFNFHDIRRMVSNEQEDAKEGAKILGHTVVMNLKHYRDRLDRVENKAAPQTLEEVDALMEKYAPPIETIKQI